MRIADQQLHDGRGAGCRSPIGSDWSTVMPSSKVMGQPYGRRAMATGWPRMSDWRVGRLGEYVNALMGTVGCGLAVDSSAPHSTWRIRMGGSVESASWPATH
jgi:hypothetical protein